MTTEAHLQLAEVQQRVCDIASEQLGIARNQISLNDRLIEDLRCDSLELVELFMDLEEAFGVTLPYDPPNSVYKAVFTRQPFRLVDLAELAYLQQGTGTPQRKRWRQAVPERPAAASVPFTQLGGRWEGRPPDGSGLFEPIDSDQPLPQYRRRSDGMRCVKIPSAAVEIGCDSPDALPDEQPQHVVHLDSFLIDAEPVSTTAYCRFLNSAGPVAPEVLRDWFLLDPEDDRNEHALISVGDTGWRPLPGSERWPMILVSWFGATAYSLWTNGHDWTNYQSFDENRLGCFLPSETQWEYAARGAHFQMFPWGDTAPSHEQMTYGLHRRAMTYTAETLPLAGVNEQLGMSPFGLHHMAGNVWQWCSDWYDERFYSKPAARAANPVNRIPNQVRSERGGSWIGPAELCRSSYRRGRPPSARGRCLGFRCISRCEELP